MNYPQLAARLEYFAKGLGALLNGSKPEEKTDHNPNGTGKPAGTDGRNE